MTTIVLQVDICRSEVLLLMGRLVVWLQEVGIAIGYCHTGKEDDFNSASLVGGWSLVEGISIVLAKFFH